jgi:hypothetical protein
MGIMPTWKVKKYRREDGSCPVDDWMQSKFLSKEDRRSIESRVTQIEGIEGLGNIPADWVVSYGDIGLHRFKKQGPQKKALRILCVRDDKTKTITFLNGVVKKDKSLPESVIREAQNLHREMNDGKGSIDDFWED